MLINATPLFYFSLLLMIFSLLLLMFRLLFDAAACHYALLLFSLIICRLQHYFFMPDAYFALPYADIDCLSSSAPSSICARRLIIDVIFMPFDDIFAMLDGHYYAFAIFRCHAYFRHYISYYLFSVDIAAFAIIRLFLSPTRLI